MKLNEHNLAQHEASQLKDKYVICIYCKKMATVS